MTKPKPTVIAPQDGPQKAFCATWADIAVYGGAAGGGKSFAIELDAARHINQPDYRAVLFRKTSEDLRAGGGLWDVSRTLYAPLGGHPREDKLEWVFPSGARIKMSHLQYDKDRYNHQGAQYDYVAFDELTQFSEVVFWFLVGRTRSRGGVKPAIRASCNPDPKSFVLPLIRWWIGEDGYPIPERSGVVRLLVRFADQTYWGDTVEDLLEQCPEAFEEDEPEDVILSFTFIASNLEDNPALLKADPSYRAKLNAQSLVERERLRKGNWLIEAEGGLVFREEWFPIVSIGEVPKAGTRLRYWDLAGTDKTDSDETSGTLVHCYDGVCWVIDVAAIKAKPKETKDFVRSVAERDGTRVPQWFEREIGGHGHHTLDDYRRNVLRGFTVRDEKASGQGGKVERADPMSAAAEAGNVRLVRAPWNDAFTKQAQAFPAPKGGHDDQVDSTVRAFNKAMRGDRVIGGSGGS